MSCQRCSKSGSSPQAFLLTCRGCSKTWHHRCHMPPVEDDELLQRLHATNMGDTSNGLSAWMCRRCKKGVSKTPSEVPSRDQIQTVSSELHGDRRSLTSTPVVTGRVASTTDVRVKQEQKLSSTVDAQSLDREQSKKSDRQESAEGVPANSALAAIRPRSSTPKPPHIQTQASPTEPSYVDVQMTVVTPTELTPQEKRSSERPSSQAPSHQDTAVRKFVNIVPTVSNSEDDVEMSIDVSPPIFSEPTLCAISRTSQAISSSNQGLRPKSTAQLLLHAPAVGLGDEPRRDARPVDRAATQHRVSEDAENDDDPEDLYGPPVERRVIRILPSLAEELRDQRRRATAGKEFLEKLGRAPLAPDWIFARHIDDPLWRIRRTVEGRKRGKPVAKKLGDNRLNVKELVGYITKT